MSQEFISCLNFYIKCLALKKARIINSTRNILVWVLALPFPSCVTLGMSQSHLSLSLCFCKIKINDICLTWLLGAQVRWEIWKHFVTYKRLNKWKDSLLAVALFLPTQPLLSMIYWKILLKFAVPRNLARIQEENISYFLRKIGFYIRYHLCSLLKVI